MTSIVANVNDAIYRELPDTTPDELSAYRDILRSPRYKNLPIKALPAIRKQQLEADALARRQGRIDREVLHAVLSNIDNLPTPVERAASLRSLVLEVAAHATGRPIEVVSVLARQPRTRSSIPPVMLRPSVRAISGQLIPADAETIASALWEFDRDAIAAGVQEGFMHDDVPMYISFAADGFDYGGLADSREERRRRRFG